MLDFFDFIIEFFTMIWNFLTNLINSFITLFTVVGRAIAIPPILVGMVPGVIGSCVVAVSAIGIAKLLLGWGNK